jgi:hypothetical protein
MTWAEFKRKWNRFQGKESSAYQEHFSDICRLLGEQTLIPDFSNWKEHDHFEVAFSRLLKDLRAEERAK